MNREYTMDSINDFYGPGEPQYSIMPAHPTAHPLFSTVETLINRGNWQAARAVLEELLIIYPHDVYLQELAASARARSALLGEAEESMVSPARGSIFARSLKLVVPGIIFLGVLCMAAGIFVSLQWWVLPEASNRHLQAEINQLKQEAQTALASGDYDRAVFAYNELLQLLPDDRQIRQELRQANELRTVISLYSEAIAEMEAHHWDNALSVLRQVEAEQPGYRDVAERINFVQTQQELLSRFNEAEAAFKQANYPQAIQKYEALQAVDYGFQSSTVQEHLFLSYRQLGLTEETAAGSDPQQLQSALDKLEKALALRPDDSQSRGESKLLRLYLGALDKYKAENWPQVVSDLTPVYETRPDFAGGKAAQLLYTAYVAWADKLFASEEFEEALAKYEAARSLTGVDTSGLGAKIALAKEALVTPTPAPAAPVIVPVSAGAGAAPAPRPTPTPIPYPYTLTAMAIRNNCGGGYIHGVIWNAYNLPLAGVTIQAINTTTGAGPFMSNPTNADGIYQIILDPDQIEGLWMVQILENGHPASLGWGQRLGGGCVNGAQELKVDWKREIQIQ
jgi:tetratricopeptide (TPR) repeat protein